MLKIINDLKARTIVGIDNMNDYYDVSLTEYRLKQLKDKSVEPRIDYHFVKGNIADKALIEKCACGGEVFD